MGTPARPPQLEPMLATPGAMPGHPEGFALEVKWDGMRVLARLDSGELELLARSGNEATTRYPELAELAALLPGRSAVLDGEVIATDARGRPSFGALQERMPLRRPTEIAAAMRRYPVTLMLFDVLWLDGRSLLDEPYERRRALLEALPLAGTRVVVPPAWPGSTSAQALAWTRGEGLEGLIAKRLGSRYRPGVRSRDWIKIKHVRSVDVVIGGWVSRDPEGQVLKSLLLGLPGEGGPRYVGAVGTGFSDAERRALAARLGALAVADSPFTGAVTDIDRGDPLRFVRPELTGEVEYLGIGSGGSLRQPVWKGLRGSHRDGRLSAPPVGGPGAGDRPVPGGRRGRVVAVLQVVEQGRVGGRPAEQFPRAGAGDGRVDGVDGGHERVPEVRGGLVRVGGAAGRPRPRAIVSAMLLRVTPSSPTPCGTPPAGSPSARSGGSLRATSRSPGRGWPSSP
ncbi:non-homologous end-joining DNA ligase [Streptacidiphilus sp. P02-A3a]|uniref:non-homologous end-joining DNA ligase n=1 Tax=Streptacidiphilus sp. P02-A3a TaxID=2704468 RepID=UPI0015FA1D2D|nr:non-homologous end-joining DNA ligase [Streptacidiphilus sp. P02-A3a]QMU70720.1 hypothetical protein GXP74_23435 [Streptacidiphilus sp. P02-A3a]